MKHYKRKTITSFNSIGLLMLVPLFLWIGCGKMNDVHEEYIKEGEIIYLGKIDSVSVNPGKNRVKLNWQLPADPKITKTIIYWNDKIDSIEIVYQKPIMQKEQSVIIDNLTEGLYSFEVYNVNNSGNSSIKSIVSTRAYGDTYLQSLFLRPVKDALFENNEGVIYWAGAASESLGSEVSYTDTNGKLNTLFVPSTESTTYLTDFTPNGSFSFRSLYVPDTTSIDTFYTEVGSQKIIGNPYELPKGNWTITASSEDPARPVTNLIDNNILTDWVNKIGGGNTYPHTVIVNLHEEITLDEREGFTITQRQSLNGALKLLEIQVSLDGVNWTSVGDFTIKSVKETQFIEAGATYQLQYFKYICKADYGNSANVPLSQIGLFKR